MMIELPRRGYGSSPSAFVDPNEIAGIHVRNKHAMDDYNTTVVTLRCGTAYDTSLTPRDVRELVADALGASDDSRR